MEALDLPGPVVAKALDGVRVRWLRTQFPNPSRRPESSVSGLAGLRRGRGERKERDREQFNANKNFNVD
jgi:hypothetical protein